MMSDTLYLRSEDWAVVTWSVYFEMEWIRCFSCFFVCRRANGACVCLYVWLLLCFCNESMLFCIFNYNHNQINDLRSYTIVCSVKLESIPSNTLRIFSNVSVRNLDCKRNLICTIFSIHHSFVRSFLCLFISFISFISSENHHHIIYQSSRNQKIGIRQTFRQSTAKTNRFSVPFFPLSTSAFFPFHSPPTKRRIINKK